MPILVDQIIPNTTINLREAIMAKLPPLASDTFMSLQLKVEAFFVPFRLMYGGFDNWIMETPLRTSTGDSYKLRLPKLAINMRTVTQAGAGSLFDMLGYRSSGPGDPDSTATVYTNIFPWLAYARIWDDWYRNSRIQAPLFTQSGNTIASDSAGDGSQYFSVANLPYISISDHANFDAGGVQNNVFDGTKTVNELAGQSGYFADGSYITDLRQRNFGMDYFTSAQPSAQRGGMRSVRMSVSGNVVEVMNTAGDETSVLDASDPITTSFTIATLRGENSLQIFAERNNFSYRMEDYNMINYGAHLKRGMATRAMFLGQHVVDVLTRTVSQSQFSSDQQSASSQNPFESVGAQYGNAMAAGNDTLVSNFTTDEHGILMVLASLVPRVTYNTGTERYLFDFVNEGCQVDFANAILQNVGNEPIFDAELVGGLGTVDAEGNVNPGTVFGYTDRYAHWMDKNDQIHGLLKDGQSLQSFALQRSFDDSVNLNSDFLQIPTTYLDQAAAVSVGVAGFNAWCEAFFDYRKIQPLHEYSIPSLQDPAYEHGRTVVFNKNGNSI